MSTRESPGVKNGFLLRKKFEEEGHYNRYELKDRNVRIIDVNMKSPAKLPFSGPGIRQVCGIRVKLDKTSGFTAPDEVCTLIFRYGSKHAVVRVWENKDHRYFVSARKGDDQDSGSEDKPFKTIHYAVTTVTKSDPDGDIYVAGGDYLEENGVNMRYKISLFGGFDDNGWLRDPIIQEPVQLPHGFRENWVDDVCERFKDLRRTDHRYYETRIRREKFEKRSYTFTAGGRRGPGRKGSPDTFVDGITVFGCPHTGVYQPTTFGVGPDSQRTIRNCIYVVGWSSGHAFRPGAGGQGLNINNITWGGIVGRDSHCRPQMIYAGAHVRRNLFVGATGGDYTRMLIMWYQGGVVEENQFHGGNSFEYSMGICVGNYLPRHYDRDHHFINNYVYTDAVSARSLQAWGFVCEGNEFHAGGGGFTKHARAQRKLVIRNNTLYIGPDRKNRKFSFLPPKETWFVGGSFKGRQFPKLVLGEGEVPKQPTIENNKIIRTPKYERRPHNHVDVGLLSELHEKQGEEVTLRPKHPATNLRAKVMGPGTVRLTWQPSKNSSVAGYRIYYGPRSNSYANNQVVDGATETTIKGLEPGKRYFSVAAHKPAFVECWTLSNEVTVEMR